MKRSFNLVKGVLSLETFGARGLFLCAKLFINFVQ